MIGGQNIKQIPDLVKIKIALRDIFKILDSTDEDQLQIHENSKLINRPIVGNIEFKDVSFKYQSREEIVLTNVSFSVKSG
jgi:ABC-type multidrug transport system fused ATPase/permease subunit